MMNSFKISGETQLARPGKLKSISNEQLIDLTKTLVAQERAKTLEVIAHIQEIYDRRLHLERGYGSLHEFLVQELKYSDGAAHRRISAMRLVREVPEASALVASGALSLTTAASVQNFFSAEAKAFKTQALALASASPPPPTPTPTLDLKPAGSPYSKEQKLKILSSVAGASRQQCEQKLQALSPSYAAKARPLVLEQDQELAALIKEYRSLAMLSDGLPTAVLKSALKAAIGNLKAKAARQEKLASSEKLNLNNANLASLENLKVKDQHTASPEKLKAQAQHKASLKKLKAQAQHQPSPEKLKAQAQFKASPEKLFASPSRYVPIKDKRAVWMRDQAQCSYTDPKTGRRCTASHKLELDHVIPHGFDGPTTSTNLQLLCRAHNQWRAHKEFRVAKEFRAARNSTPWKAL